MSTSALETAHSTDFRVIHPASIADAYHILVLSDGYVTSERVELLTP